MSTPQCPTLDDLRAFLDGGGDRQMLAGLDTHVDLCPDCQETLDVLTRRSAYDLADFGEGDAPGVSDGADRQEEGEFHLGLPGEPDGGAATVTIGETATDPGTVEDGRDGDVPSVGTRRSIGPYELLGVLGQGGMGVVYRARHRGLNRLVALKMIRGEGPIHPDQLARFRTEAEAVARIRDPHILQIFDIGEVDGLPYVSLELLEGGSLDDRLGGTPQPGRQAAEMLATLARAVQVAHDAGIVHRDLKPSNVLFTAEGLPKVADFGLAKMLESDSRQTQTGAIMGSPSYMAPEQASGHTKDVKPAADVYALGAILYEMLTGRPPFKGETPMDTVRQVIDVDPVPPSRLVPRVDRDIETICLKCLSKDPARRYRSASALADDLDRFRAGEPIEARRTPHWERAAKWARRHPARATLMALGFAAAIGSICGLVAYDRHRRLEDVLRLQRLAELRASSDAAIFGAQQALARQDRDAARTKLLELRTRIESERGVEDLYARAGEMLGEIDGQIAVDRARGQDRARYEDFSRKRLDAVFRETQFPGLDTTSGGKGAEEPALAALALYAAAGPSQDWRLATLPATLSAREQDEIREGCFELLLILADIAESPAEGLRRLDRAAALQPPSPTIHLRRAACLARLGDGVGAARERNEAGKLAATSAFDHFLIGKEHHRRREWSTAISHFDEALRLRPGHFWSHCLSAICRIQLNQPVPAKSELTACLQAEPRLAWLYLLRGFASYQAATLVRTAAAEFRATGNTLRDEGRRQLEAADADYEAALRLLAEHPNDHLRYALLVNRGLLRFERKEWDGAVADLEAAIRLDGRQYLARESLALVRQKQGLADEAVAEFGRVIDLRPGLARLYRGRAAVELDRAEMTPEQKTRALSDLEAAIRLEAAGSPVLVLDHTNRGRLLLGEGRAEDALAACDSALGIDPMAVDAHRVRVEALRKLKRHGEAIRSCDALLARGRPSADLLLLRGLAKEDTRDYVGAIEDFTQAIALRPAGSSLRARRGGLYLVTDAYRLALGDFEESVRLDPKNPDALNGRGMAKVALGHYSEGVADAAQALGMAPPTPARLYNSARVYARAASAAAGDVRRRGQDAVALVARYQDRALSLLQEAIDRQPPDRRAAFVREVVLADPALGALGRRLRSLQGS